MKKSGDPGTACQLTLFALETVATADCGKVDHKNSHKVDNSFSDAPELPLAQEHFIKPGDWVQLSPDWMKKCEAATKGSFKKDYQFKSEKDLICQVTWVDPRANGNIAVSRNGWLYVPHGCFTVLEQDTQEVLPIVEYLEKIGGVGVARRRHRQFDVLERDTKNAVPEHKTPGFGSTTGVPEHTQWVEEYRPSTRKANSYYRYCYKQSRKIKHIHIPGGNTRSHLAQNRKVEVESAIASGNSPGEIKHLIQSWSGTNE
ncbi:MULTISPECIES: hypothetical protein [Calothrix]|uniref:Uncharacterized protein n=2 Tax=Calothrix TaxID=1186 RepID=A0ABR8ADT7_9CYAN|nr:MULTISPECIES: hypothetical protein [Calothrix]MBD2197934.1 hypothetical protein [Calothrix parietina FACHB-288]MBD2226781.1 hypothetical protein [Calothrix anomala FACHB-343]